MQFDIDHLAPHDNSCLVRRALEPDEPCLCGRATRLAAITKAIQFAQQQILDEVLFKIENAAMEHKQNGAAFSGLNSGYARAEHGLELRLDEIKTIPLLEIVYST